MLVKGDPGGCAIWDIRPKSIFNTNLSKSRLRTAYFAATHSFYNSAQSTALLLSCSVKHSKTIGQLKQIIWTDEVLRDFSLRWFSDGYSILHSTIDLSLEGLYAIIFKYSPLKISSYTSPAMGEVYWSRHIWGRSIDITWNHVMNSTACIAISTVVYPVDIRSSFKHSHCRQSSTQPLYTHFIKSFTNSLPIRSVE